MALSEVESVADWATDSKRVLIASSSEVTAGRARGSEEGITGVACV